MLAIHFDVPWPDLWINISAIYTWIPDLFSIDLGAVFERLSLPIPSSTAPYVKFAALMVLPAAFLTSYGQVRARSPRCVSLCVAPCLWCCACACGCVSYLCESVFWRRFHRGACSGLYFIGRRTFVRVSVSAYLARVSYIMELRARVHGLSCARCPFELVHAHVTRARRRPR